MKYSRVRRSPYMYVLLLCIEELFLLDTVTVRKTSYPREIETNSAKRLPDVDQISWSEKKYILSYNYKNSSVFLGKRYFQECIIALFDYSNK